VVKTNLFNIYNHASSFNLINSRNHLTNIIIHLQNHLAISNFNINGEYFKPDFESSTDQSQYCDDLVLVRMANHWMEQASLKPVPLAAIQAMFLIMFAFANSKTV